MKYILLVLFGFWLVGQVVSCDKENEKDTQQTQNTQQVENPIASDIKKVVQIEEPISQEELKKQQEEEKKIARKKLIEQQFSSWDGSHKVLKKAVKQTMHNPDSFKHVETFYNDFGDRIRVTMRYRGTNAFGAVVLQQVKAEFDLQGNFIRVIK